MWNFIVSGYIPGTDLQITFDVFAMFGSSFMTVFLLFILVRSTMRDMNKLTDATITAQTLEEIAL